MCTIWKKGLCRCNYERRGRTVECHAKMEAEVRLMQQQAKESQALLGATRNEEKARRDSFLEPSERECGSGNILIFGLLVSELWQNKFLLLNWNHRFKSTALVTCLCWWFWLLPPKNLPVLQDAANLYKMFACIVFQGELESAVSPSRSSQLRLVRSTYPSLGMDQCPLFDLLMSGGLSSPSDPELAVIFWTGILWRLL